MQITHSCISIIAIAFGLVSLYSQEPPQLERGVGTWDRITQVSSSPVRLEETPENYPGPGYAVVLHIRYYLAPESVSQIADIRRWLYAASTVNYIGIISYINSLDLVQDKAKLWDAGDLDNGLSSGWQVQANLDRFDGDRVAYIDLTYRFDIALKELDHVDAYLDKRLSATASLGRNYLRQRVFDLSARNILEL